MMKKALVLLCCSVLPFGGVLADTASEQVEKAVADAMAIDQAENVDQAEEAGNVAIMGKEIDSAENPREGIERYEQFKASREKASTD